MSHLASLDKALVLILIPLWVICFGLAVRTQVQGGGVLWIGVSADDERGYPVLTGEYARPYPSNPLTDAGLEVNDVLLRAGNADLRGVGFAGFLWRARAEAKGALGVELSYERDGEPGVVTIALWPISTFVALLPVSLAFALSALWLLLRAKPTPAVRAYFRFGMCIAISALFFLGSALEAALWPWMVIIAGTFQIPLALHFAFLFPDDQLPEGRWHRIWPLSFAIYGVFVAFTMFGHYTVGDIGFVAVANAGAVATVAVAIRKYRRGGPVTRRQLRWVLLGTVCAVFPITVATAAMAIEPRFGWMFMPSIGAFALVPLSVVVSVVRFNLFDVDRLLSGAASYTVLTIVLAFSGEVLLEPLAGRVSSLLGLDPATGQVAFVVAVAALLVPTQRALRPHVNRIFFAGDRALEKEMEELLEELTHSEGASSVLDLAGGGVAQLFELRTCAIYQRVGAAFEPRLVTGSILGEPLPVEGEVIQALETRVRPALLDTRGTTSRERAELELPGADAALLVPLRAEGALTALLCLGPKQSGDVFTPTDLSLLAALGHLVSTRLPGSPSEGLERAEVGAD